MHINNILNDERYITIVDKIKNKNRVEEEFLRVKMEAEDIFRKGLENLTSKRIDTKISYDCRSKSWQLGLNKNGVGVGWDLVKDFRISNSKLENLKTITDLKNVDWYNFIQELNLKGDKKERINIIAEEVKKIKSDIKDSSISDLEIEIIDNKGSKEIIRSIYIPFGEIVFNKVNTGIIIDCYNFTIGDFLIIDQIYDLVMNLLDEYIKNGIEAIEFNKSILEETKNRLSYYLIYESI